MRHLKKGKKFGRKKDQRYALMRLLAESLIKRGKIKTTQTKAKELRPFVEKMVTRAKTGTLASRRIILARLGVISTKKLFSDIGPKYKDRKGGYTRIIKMGIRKSDATKMAVIEFV